MKSEHLVNQKGVKTFNQMRNDLIFIMTWDTGINEHTKKKLYEIIAELTAYLGL